MFKVNIVEDLDDRVPQVLFDPTAFKKSVFDALD
jgi:hypothetical protein